MSTRDELAEALFNAQHPEGFWLDGYSEPPTASYEDMADALIAEGWRKKPEADDVVAVVQRHWEAWTGRESEDFSTIVTSSIMALMDRGLDA